MSELLIQLDTLLSITDAIREHLEPEIQKDLIASPGVFATNAVRERARFYDGIDNPSHRLHEQNINRYDRREDWYSGERKFCLYDSNDTRYTFWFDRVMLYNDVWGDLWEIRDENYDPRDPKNYVLTNRIVDNIAFTTGDMPTAIQKIADTKYQLGVEEGKLVGVNNAFRYYSPYYAQTIATGTSSMMHEGTQGLLYYRPEELRLNIPALSGYGVGNFTSVIKLINPGFHTWIFKNTNPYLKVAFFFTITYGQKEGVSQVEKKHYDMITIDPNESFSYEFQTVLGTTDVSMSIDGYRLSQP